MKTIDYNKVAFEIATSENVNSNRAISAMFNELSEKYGKDVAKDLIKRAKDIFKSRANGFNDRLSDAKQAVDNSALRIAWTGLRKDKNPAIRQFFGLAGCKYERAEDFLKDWYPHTLNGVPAYKRNGVWTAYEYNANNALRLLKTCFNTLCKAGKTNFRGKGLAKDHAND